MSTLLNIICLPLVYIKCIINKLLLIRRQPIKILELLFFMVFGILFLIINIFYDYIRLFKHSFVSEKKLLLKHDGDHAESLTEDRFECIKEITL